MHVMLTSPPVRTIFTSNFNVSINYSMLQVGTTTSRCSISVSALYPALIQKRWDSTYNYMSDDVKICTRSLGWWRYRRHIRRHIHTLSPLVECAQGIFLPVSIRATVKYRMWTCWLRGKDIAVNISDPFQESQRYLLHCLFGRDDDYRIWENWR